MIGITSFGAYIPKLRLERAAIVQSMGWFAPAIMMVAQGQRSMCNWDEDALTMAVAAARDCLTGKDKQRVEAMFLASTSLPFADRQNAGIVATALNLSSHILTSDFTSSQKAGSTALLTALETLQGGARRNILVTASDRRETRTAYFYEMWYGDGAAALMVGDTDVIAEFKGAFSVSYDFVDHYRGAGHAFDYVWEERWARDEGYSKIIPEAVNGLLAKLGLSIKDVDHLIYPCIFKAEHANIAKKLGAATPTVADNMHEICGETGTAHPLLMLARALETARPGQRIVVAGFGQGCNALCFEVTDAILKVPPRSGVSGALANQKRTDNYAKWLKFRELIDPEMGIRAEAPTQTAMTTLWRKRQMLLGLMGGRCRTCGTPQFPKMDICVNPECGALHSQDNYEFADQPARVKTFTGDLLAVSMDPPHKYGMVQFDNGGRMMADFTDCDFEELQVGLPVQMVFRKRSEDKQRGFVNYFWKATPAPGAAEEMKKIRFDGRVAIVTGAGRGLGRAYALELARRGASVVVNDLGGARDGAGGGSATPAEEVVAEIKAAGGQAVTNADNVATAQGGESIVQCALKHFGHLDIVINNAGILRDKTFVKMEPENWQAVLDVHLNGAFHVTRPAMAAMRDNGYGRILFTSSAAGLYGNFGQTNYAAAKMALVGLMNTLKLEGAKHNIKVNTIAPLAASRLTEDVMPPDLFQKAQPEYAVPMALYLCSESCNHSGTIFNAGMGYFSRAAVLTGNAVQLSTADRFPTVEDIADHWERINDMSGAKELADLNAATIDLMTPVSAKTKPATPEAQPKTEKVDTSIDAVFAKLAGTFKADAAQGVDVVFQFSISGTGGGEWSCAIRDQACTIATGKHASPTCNLKMTAEDFGAMIAGQVSPIQAFTSGKLKIEGDVMKSQLIEKLFVLGK